LVEIVNIFHGPQESQCIFLSESNVDYSYCIVSTKQQETHSECCYSQVTHEQISRELKCIIQICNNESQKKVANSLI